MKFAVEHERDAIGNRIDLTVTSEAQRLVARVKTTLDGSTLEDETLDTPSLQYQRTFRQAGSAGVGQTHVLVVEAFDEKYQSEAATSRWEDAV